MIAIVRLTLETGEEKEVRVPLLPDQAMLLIKAPELYDCVVVASAFELLNGLMAEDNVMAAKLATNEYAVIYRHEVVAIGHMVSRCEKEGKDDRN